MQYLLNGKNSIQTKQSPVIFVQQFSFVSEKIFPSVRQLSGNISEVFGKTVHDSGPVQIIIILHVLCMAPSNKDN